MGMYTELTLGAQLKSDVPTHVIGILQFMMGKVEEPPEEYPFPDGRFTFLLYGESSYFPSGGERKLWEIDGTWYIHTRSNIKNYKSEIETFLEWLKPYIANGRLWEDFDETDVESNSEQWAFYNGHDKIYVNDIEFGDEGGMYASVHYEEWSSPTRYFL